LRRIAQALSLAVFLLLFLYIAWPYGSKDYAALRDSKEIIPAEAFLALDPLVSLSTAAAERAWVWSLAWAGVLLAVSLVLPRMFCGYLCPLGTLVDVADWLVGRRAAPLHLGRGGWWRHLRYYVLAGVMAAAAAGVLVSGFLAAIPVLVRGLAFVLSPVQTGAMKAWYLVPPVGAGQVVSIALFAAVFGLALLGPRFWCRTLCPSGAVFSAANALRLTERKVTAACTKCGKCIMACTFDAIRPDFSTRPAECTFCQTCGGACPVAAIEFASRGRKPAGTLEYPRPYGRGSGLSRRGLLGGAAGGLAAAIGIRPSIVAGEAAPDAAPPVRPPGSVPEPDFLRLCIRCGLCYQACPNNVLQPMGLAGGLDGLWTPAVVADWSGCEPSCNNCGHMCPTGAIRALEIAEKRAARMGLAVVNGETCLPFAGREACRMCVDECRMAGYDAIEFVRVGVETDADGKPIEDTGYLAPVVIAEKCVGCGLCQTRCTRINVKAKGLLAETAIRIEAGPGREDRLTCGSYLALRESERKAREAEEKARQRQGGGAYLPDFLK
jgi:MauM/NapG family ferredoxin protein